MMLMKNEFTNDVSLKNDRNAIRQAIMNLVLTRRGEKPFNRNFGVGLHDLLFESPSPSDLQRLEMDIIHQVALREPRATVESVDFDTSKMDSNEFTATINYVVHGGTQAEPISDSLRIEITKVR